jgi:bifunctional DNA-binding transcriptional regulator/antitoxin component of YhaV-PrlF toxin-antitoxin module|tara:strand:- start:713 stop:859 length:147 start_codon:yes stop_codon:yes gene_type:complete
MKLQYDTNNQFKVTLPKKILEAMGWKKGDKIKVELDAFNNLVLKNEDK